MDAAAAALLVLMWDSVMRELFWIRSLIPLFYIDISSPWHDTVFASDASEFCSKKLPSSTVQQYSSQSERW
eukprot:5897670-Karenia_brevis.AAC.1